MAGRQSYAIIFAAFVAIAAAAPVHPDAVVPEQGEFPDTIVPEVQAEKEALIGVSDKAEGKSGFGWLGKITGLDDDPYGYSDYGSPKDTDEDEAAAACYDSMEQEIDDKVDAEYTKNLGEYGSYVPYAAKKHIKAEAKEHVQKEMEKKGLKGSCQEYVDDGACGMPEVDALCAKSCDACGEEPAGSGSGMMAPPVPPTGSALPTVQQLFQDLHIDGMLYKEEQAQA